MLCPLWVSRGHCTERLFSAMMKEKAQAFARSSLVNPQHLQILLCPHSVFNPPHRSSLTTWNLPSSFKLLASYCSCWIPRTISFLFLFFCFRFYFILNIGMFSCLPQVIILPTKQSLLFWSFLQAWSWTLCLYGTRSLRWGSKQIGSYLLVKTCWSDAADSAAQFTICCQCLVFFHRNDAPSWWLSGELFSQVKIIIALTLLQNKGSQV